MTNLVYFTNRYPFDTDSLNDAGRASWKTTELRTFRDYFDRIVVAPFERREKERHDVPPDIEVLSPLLDPHRRRERLHVTRLFGPRLWKHLQGLRGSRGSLGAVKFQPWLNEALTIEAALRSRSFRQELRPVLKDSLLYFFWGRGYANILPFLPRRDRMVSMVRFHGYDLYADRNGGFIPYQGSVVRAAARLVPVSEDGVRYLVRQWPSSRSKLFHVPLGALPGGLSRRSHDGVLRVVSCSYLRPIKRVELIAESLRYFEGPVEWTHIGDGPERNRLESVIDKSEAQRVRLLGAVPHESVRKIYEDSRFDVFISASRGEGAPVSMMEALAAGIPIIATDVGGTREIVDSSVGMLLPANPDPQQIAEALSSFAKLSNTAVDEMRRACRQKFETQFNALENSGRTAKLLLSIQSDGV